VSKLIRVEGETYDRLEAMKRRGETFDHVIRDMLDSRLSVFQLVDVLEGKARYADWKAEQIRKGLEDERPGDRSPMPHVSV